MAGKATCEVKREEKGKKKAGGNKEVGERGREE